MEEVILHFKDIVQHYVVDEDQEEDRRISEARIRFINTSKLVARDVLIFLDNDAVQRRYSFQWMNADNTLIIRWDNAPHHSELDNFPHHLHKETNQNVHASPEMTLYSVLVFIQNMIR